MANDRQARKRHRAEQNKAELAARATKAEAQTVTTLQSHSEIRPQTRWRPVLAWLSPSLTDLLMVVFTGILTYVGSGQLDAIRKQQQDTFNQLKVMRNDQRAWVSVEQKDPIRVTVGAPLEATVEMKNTGRTPALHIDSHFLVEILDANAEPHFEMFNLLSGHVTAGMLFPAAISDSLIERGDRFGVARSQPTQPVTDAEKKKLDERGSWIALHGWVRYLDVFGTQHWVSFCRFTGPPGGSYRSRSCSQYNSVDENGL